ncbi:hypothetical protein SeLEV6574_g01646 [Synchytrium endobioticum]|uniref:Kinesin-like protein n=1 Tax=Synchytrium endobioticum TaxID=286115 RepID=A0A507DC16_9FUNG|nr:hypothetical protein SeLEV6574_g01646 [Synchytrium endobioticum]
MAPSTYTPLRPILRNPEITRNAATRPPTSNLDEHSPPWNATTTMTGGVGFPPPSILPIASAVPSSVNSPPKISPRLLPPREPIMKGPRSSNTSPSKAAIEVAKLKAAREERRARQAERKRELQELNSEEREHRDYLVAISSFRNEFERQVNALGHRLKRTGRNDSDRIRVCMRARPFNHRETHDHLFNVITSRTSTFPFSHCYIHEPRQRVDQSKEVLNHRFIFDDVFDETATNADVYNGTAKPLVESVFRGGKATFFAYGQTSSGKTHTIFGNEREPGIYDYATRDLFKMLKPQKGTATDTFALEVQFFEIYGGRVFDLLANKSRVEILEDAKGNARLVGLTSVPAGTPDELRRLVASGSAERTTGATDANSESSRSHAVLQLSILREAESGRGMNAVGRLALVDLAGSERAIDTAGKNVPKHRQVEAAEINKSLLALKECIRALHRKCTAHDGERHVPFRASKLTQVLRDSFIGPQSQTVMIASVAPSNASVEHTLNTLRYADRVKEFRSVEGGKHFGAGEEVTRPGLDLILQDEIDDDLIGSNDHDDLKALPGESTSPRTEHTSPVSSHGSGLESVAEVNEGVQDLARPPLRPSSTSSTTSKSPKHMSLKSTKQKLSSRAPKLPKLLPPSIATHHHTRSLSDLLEEEDALHRLHKSILLQVRELDETEAKLLHNVSLPDHDVDQYIGGLEKVIRRRRQALEHLSEKLSHFKKHLDEAEQ